MLAGEFLVGGWWVYVVWKKQATLRPSVVFFLIDISEKKYFQERITLETYDKTKENTNFFKEFLKYYTSSTRRFFRSRSLGDFLSILKSQIFTTARSSLHQKILPCPCWISYSFITCCCLRPSAVVLQRISAPSEIFSGTVDFIFSISIAPLAKFLMR